MLNRLINFLKTQKIKILYYVFCGVNHLFLTMFFFILSTLPKFVRAFSVPNQLKHQRKQPNMSAQNRKFSSYDNDKKDWGDYSESDADSDWDNSSTDESDDLQTAKDAGTTESGSSSKKSRACKQICPFGWCCKSSVPCPYEHPRNSKHLEGLTRRNQEHHCPVYSSSTKMFKTSKKKYGKSTKKKVVYSS